jgi:hypothetical protein
LAHLPPRSRLFLDCANQFERGRCYSPPFWLAEDPLGAPFTRPLPGPEIVLSPGLPVFGRGFDGPANGFGSVADVPVEVADVPVDAVVPGEGLASGNTRVLAGGSVVAAGGGVVTKGDRGAIAATSLLDWGSAGFAGFGPLTICPSNVITRSNTMNCPSWRGGGPSAIMVSVPLALANRPVPPVIVMTPVAFVAVPVTV